MNGEYNSSIEPGTDIGLSLGCTLTNKSGVGANAGSMVHVKYVPTDSLSELVWSPHKGLSLRCADSNFWNPPPDNATFALPQEESHFASKLQTHTPAKGVGSYANLTIGRAEMSAACFKQDDLQTTGGLNITENISVNEVLTIGRNDCPYFPVDMNKVDEVSMKQDEPELHELQHELLDLDRKITTEKDILHPLNAFDPTVTRPTLGKFESSAENNLQIVNPQNAGCERSKIKPTAMDSSGKRNCKNRGDGIQRKGKEKALSDGNNVCGIMLKNEENSCGSVESCSSAFLSTSKRRWSFEQPSIVGNNKRAKRLEDENNAQDSSFMNWISNMMKGFSDSIQDEEVPSPDLTLAKPTNKKSNPPGFSATGFLSIFRSLYSPRAKEEAKENGNTCDLNAIPISCFGEPEISCSSQKSLENNVEIDDICKSNSGENVDFTTTAETNDPLKMASIFARRLGAFKHIIPSRTEIEDRSRNIRLCNETVECPTGCQQLSESRADLADHQHVEDRKMDGVATSQNPNIIKTELRLDCKVTQEVKPAALSTPKCVIPRFFEKNSKQAVFNEVIKLRLTRSNILKCMNSHVSLSQIDGFFLRIRLGKWEEGLGGTGYHVACIKGVQLTTNSITVIVRGVECQVQTQYISNHDFLENELRAWWCAASKDGSRQVPQAADLRAKFKKKKYLGL